MSIEAHNDDLDAAACAAARLLGMGETMFKSLPIGARFVFRREDIGTAYGVMIRERHGYRHEAGGRLWRTGARTACFML